MLRRLWRSIGFRLAFHYGLLVAITMMAALAVVYLQTVGVLYQRMVRQVSATASQLAVRFDEGGAEALAAEISRALDDGLHSDYEMYLLLDPEGRRIAGNLDELPPAPPGAATEGVMQRRVTRYGESLMGHLLVRRFNDGSVLVVGHDLSDQEALESLIANASAAAAIVVLLLLVGGIFVLRQELERSVAGIRRTTARISSGELQDRVAVPASGDEFALLSGDINNMLDRIQSLMEGVRHVSNTIAHNLRTPLTRILFRLREAQSNESNAEARQEAIGSAIREIEELTVVFEKLLQIAEAEAGARRRTFGAVALDAIAQDVVELYEAVAEAQSAVLLHEPADDAAWVTGDRDLLAGAVANLVDNALKFGGAGATVRVGTQLTPQGRVRLTVQDDGPGIPAEERGRIGTRFHRLDRGVPGHGLGLASVQAVIALHGGQMQLLDAAPGLRVQVEFPALQD